jgi:hypothetical protein
MISLCGFLVLRFRAWPIFDDWPLQPGTMRRCRLVFASVEFRVESIEVLGIQMILYDSQRFPETGGLK